MKGASNMTTVEKILSRALLAWILLALAIQFILLANPNSRFKDIIAHISAYGWCTIVCAIVAAIPITGLYGLILKAREYFRKANK